MLEPLGSCRASPSTSLKGALRGIPSIGSSDAVLPISSVLSLLVQTELHPKCKPFAHAAGKTGENFLFGRIKRLKLLVEENSQKHSALRCGIRAPACTVRAYLPAIELVSRMSCEWKVIEVVFFPTSSRRGHESVDLLASYEPALRPKVSSRAEHRRLGYSNADREKNACNRSPASSRTHLPDRCSSNVDDPRLLRRLELDPWALEPWSSLDSVTLTMCVHLSLPAPDEGAAVAQTLARTNSRSTTDVWAHTFASLPVGAIRHAVGMDRHAGICKCSFASAQAGKRPLTRVASLECPMTRSTPRSPSMPVCNLFFRQLLVNPEGVSAPASDILGLPAAGAANFEEAVKNQGVGGFGSCFIPRAGFVGGVSGRYGNIANLILYVLAWSRPRETDS